MNLEQLKSKATAAEACLIETVEALRAKDDVDRFIKILNENILGMTDAWMDRRQAEGIKRAFASAIEEFNKKDK